jgi:hypothetical protein
MSQTDTKHDIVRRFEEQCNAVPVEQHDETQGEEFPQGAYINDDATIMLIPNGVEKVGMIDMSDFDTTPERIEETTHEDTDVVCYVANSTYTTLKKEYLEKVTELRKGLETEDQILLVTSKGDTYPVVFDTDTPYRIMVAPFVTNPGFGSSLKVAPDGVDEPSEDENTDESGGWETVIETDVDCAHGRTVATDDDPCPFDATKQYVDDNGDTFALCGQHYQDYIGNVMAHKLAN